MEQFAIKNNWLLLPLYKYEHSGCSYAIKPFECRWDSGQVGAILINKDSYKQHDDLVMYAQYLATELCEANY